MTSLASKLKDSKFLATNFASDSNVSIIRSYFLSKKHVKPDIKCQWTKCLIEEERKKETVTLKTFQEIKEWTHPMCFCFSCNRTFHLVCFQLNLETFSNQPAPFLCNECKLSPDNEVAQKYYSSANWGKLTIERRKLFLKADSIEKYPNLIGDQSLEVTWDPDDILAIQDFKSYHVVDDYNREMETLGQLFKNYQLEAEARMKTMQQKIDELERSRQPSTSTFSTQYFTAPPFSSTFNTRVDSNPAEISTSESILKKFFISLQTDKANASAQRTQTSQVNETIRPPNVNATFTQNPPRTPTVNFNPPNDQPQEFDESSLNVSERILLHTTRACLESVNAQKQTANTKLLDLKRKALPKLSTFKGDPKGWISFKKEIYRYKESGLYDDEIVKFYVYGALEGDAKKRIEDLIDTATLDEVLKVLEASFGHIPTIIKAIESDILKVRIKGDLVRSDVVMINTLIQSYFTTCRYANVQRVNSNMLAEHIIEQLESTHRILFRQHCRAERPLSETVLPDLDMVYSFLEAISSSLDVKPKDKKDKPAQLQTITNNSFSPSAQNNQARSTDYHFSVRDIAIATHQGYYMNAVNALTKRCYCCDSTSHFTIECYRFKGMDDQQRSQLITNKGLCRNCLLTTDHQAKHCNVKPHCGRKISDENFCKAKHHAILHYVGFSSGPNRTRPSFNGRGNGRGNFNRRNNGNHNSQRAQNTYDQNKRNNSSANDSSSSQQNQSNSSTSSSHQTAIQSNQSQTAAATNLISSANVPCYKYAVTAPLQKQCIAVSSDRTVKVFKNRFFGPYGETIGYSIGDSGSEITIMRDDLREQLGIEGKPTSLSLQWTDSQIRSIPAIEVVLEVQGLNKGDKIIALDKCYAVEAQYFSLPARSLDVEALKSRFPYLKAAKFDSYFDAVPILLIGSLHASCIEAIAPSLQEGINKPVAIKTRLGWSIYGGSSESLSETSSQKAEMVASTEIATDNNDPKGVSNSDLTKLLTFYSSVESLGIRAKSAHVTDSERRATELIENEMRILPNGTVEVPLIWDVLENRTTDKNGNVTVKKIWPKLPNNHAMAYMRQLGLEKKLAKHSDQRKAYNENFLSLIKENYVRLATEKDLKTEWTNIWYLPMSIVANVNKVPVKYRNVYDASAKFQGISLNDRLLMGPNLLVDILRPIFHMRMNKIAFTCDVKSMFHRIAICERDQQCQRILWRPDENQPMQTYIMKVMLFGPKSSPFSSQFVKNKTAEKWENIYPEAAHLLKYLTYMDDSLTSEGSVEDAIRIAHQAIEILKSINWDLIGFQSNSLELLRNLPDTHVKQELIPLLSDENEIATTKVLGCLWDPKSDSFIYQFDKNIFVKLVTECHYRPTKRDQCSTIARLYDVLGFVAPFTIRGRILLQRSWRKGLDWDDKISEEDAKEWSNWLKSIEQISNLKVPRQYAKIDRLKDCDSIELHVFADAGKEAFAAVGYFVITIKDIRHSNIVLAKAKVTPVKLGSGVVINEMPRLECLSCLIAARLCNTICSLHPKMSLRIYLWSDSEIVLRWIKKKNHRLPKYAHSAIDEILELTEREQWRYVPSKDNPADLATKFQDFDFSDANSKWYKGPPFLLLTSEFWPEQKHFSDEQELETFQLATVINSTPSQFSSQVKLPAIDCPFASHFFINKFSNSIKSKWSKLVRATARALKFYEEAIIPLAISVCRKKEINWKVIKETNDAFQSLSAANLEKAELFLVRKMQHDIMAKDINLLKRRLPVSSRDLAQLNVFLDDQFIIRINSRVALDPLIYPQRFAPVVPREHPLTKIMLFHIHEKYNHVCLESQIADLRTKFWLPKARAEVRKIKTQCNHCGFRRANKQVPIMAPLPECRIDPNLRPFQVTAVDCTGAISVYKHTRECKMYLLLFTCTLTRFVYVHIVEKLDTLCVLEAITQFWTAFGPVSEFLSDNGTNFKGASNRLKRDQKIQDISKELNTVRQEIKQQLAQKYALNWRFIPAYSPWFGGSYERLIKEVKRAFEGTINKKKLTKTELNIAVQDAAQRLNNRPLTHNAISDEDAPILTPHILAKGRSGWPLLPSNVNNNYEPEDIKDRYIYHRGRKLADEIMQRFVTEYLSMLTRRDKWFKNVPDLEIGDLVLHIDPAKTRSAWPRAKVVEVYRGRDNHVRIADIKYADQSTAEKVTAQRLAKIEIQKLDPAF
ncbi:hypothetical protein PVAND_017597 [Polypedilum vanderplanki]|uniref:Integrase catalytic domain-containing protein n=1 Tax=Polypedilum vanderplanki TaxID=319348 RepID=A0A9J6B913_POLVA|nr:hypothetical protein PVAND_017597 [Polypedilum vanderplanki]